MQFCCTLRTGFLTIGLLVGSLCVWAQPQNAPSNASATELKGLPPRVAPTEYQAHAQTGAVTIAAEFMAHSVATPEATYTSEDYVVVEAALFGPADGRAMLSKGDFSLRINGRKVASPSQPYELVFHSLK